MGVWAVTGATLGSCFDWGFNVNRYIDQMVSMHQAGRERLCVSMDIYARIRQSRQFGIGFGIGFWDRNLMRWPVNLTGPGVSRHRPKPATVQWCPQPASCAVAEVLQKQVNASAQLLRNRTSMMSVVSTFVRLRVSMDIAGFGVGDNTVSRIRKSI